MEIAGRKIGLMQPPYIVAEISGNHCGSLSRAKELIRQARKAGADAVKTQCYTPDTITLDIKRPDFIVQDGLWKGRSLYELYGKAHTPLEWHEELYRVAEAEGIPIFSSVFDRTSVDLLESLGCPAYKIASFEIVDTPLIEYVTKTGKPMVISTGLASNREIIEADIASNRKAAFLHCTSEYPGTVEYASLGRMAMIDQLLRFNSPIGISDHTVGIEVPVAATALKAAIIEKHLKMDYGPESEDAEFSLTPEQFSNMCEAVRRTHEALTIRPVPQASRQLRRSLYAVADIKEGEEFTEENIRSIRPGYGAAPKMLPRLLGQRSPKNYRKGDRL